MHGGFMVEIAGGILLAVGALFGIYLVFYVLHAIFEIWEQGHMQRANAPREKIKEPLGVRIRHTVISSPSPYLHS